MGSIASITPLWKYDVFISFRGTDTHNNFTSHLYAALWKRGVETFMDYGLNRGEEITPALLKAIEESMVAIIIFSQNYASSPWCLDELVHIMDCKKKRGQIVLPVFYNVNPSHVEEQSGEFGIAFLRLREQFKEIMGRVKKWRAALTEAANLSGWDSSVVRPESTLITEIVKDIWKKLNHVPSNDTEGLVGIESSTKRMDDLLGVECADVRIVGIWGMGGIGKTTIAEVMFNRISSLFDGCCFLTNVREETAKKGIHRLWEELLSILLEDNNLNIDMRIAAPNYMIRRLRHKKVLIVLDDVNNLEQLECLAGKLEWFAPGSRIIVTTRERHVLISHGVDLIYEAKDLNEEHALELFNRHAFRQKHHAEELTELSVRAINYCKGLPLALKVLGSSLYGRSVREWVASLNKLERHSNNDIQRILRISFDGLDDLDKSLFLDIACYFRGQDTDYVAKILTSFGFYPDSGIRELVDHSLITVLDNTLGMHDLLQDMGREIVREESMKEPGKRSRLWDHDDVVHVLTQKTGTEHVECMVIDLSKSDEKQFSSKAFMKMKNLRLLDVHGAYGDRKVHLSGGFKFLYYKLKCLCWEGYPLKYLPSNFNPKKLIMLEMPRSCIKQLWKGILHLNQLQYIDLSHSQYLTETPDFTGVPNLECLILEGCTSLYKVDLSIGHLKKLVLLNLKDCNSLRSYPSSISLESLESLVLSGCSKLGKFPEILGNMEHLLKLALDGTAICELPFSIKHLTGLVFLSLRNCKNLGSLPSNIHCLKSLKNLDLFGCSKLETLPQSLGYLKCLEELDVGDTAIIQPPTSIASLENLKLLSFRGSKPVARNWLYKLFISGKTHASVGLLLPSLEGLRSLTELDLRECNLSEGMLPRDFSCLSSLRRLNISKNNFVNMPESISQLPQLQYLNLDYCKSLEAFPKLPATIHQIYADNCTSLETLSSQETIADKCMWPIFYFTNCFKLAENQEGNNTAFKFVRSHLQSLLRSQLQKNSYSSRRFDVIVPGTDIPHWFCQQNMGPSVEMHLAPHWYGKKLKGLAVCAVFANHEAPVFFTSSSASDIAICCQVEAIESSMEAMDSSVTPSFKFLIYGVPSIQSDHLWMGFDSQIRFGKLNWLNKCSQLQASFESCIPGVEVKKCGIRLVYDQDDDDCNLIMVEPRSPYENFGLSYQVAAELIMVDHGSKLKRGHVVYTATRASCDGSSNEEEAPSPKRSKIF